MKLSYNCQHTNTFSSGDNKLDDSQLVIGVIALTWKRGQTG